MMSRRMAMKDQDFQLCENKMINSGNINIYHINDNSSNYLFLATQENKNWDVVIVDSLLLTDLT